MSREETPADSTQSDLAVPKEMWEAPDIRSLEAPEVNGGAFSGITEAYHVGLSSVGTLS